MKVVFHVDEVEKWQEATRNIQNLLNLVQDAEIVLVANGSGVQSYQLEHAQKFISKYPNVSFHACKNALKAFLMENAVPEGVTVVSAGVLDLIQLQEAGFTYIKP
ncbi:sulfur reduction protein DsrE [Enterococcus saigonensis]|uniref:Sulfur reduction protein DsrE n=1 Tax=Enterococcus saigonensis TaxID=1805431 RepID=A0A679IGZ7_9ENTE|nr:DsrE family protein [Enterococcus saigonensis]BCA85212.1 sulfur reduction protein DsrE [Enterococcus saigonensis]